MEESFENQQQQQQTNFSKREIIVVPPQYSFVDEPKYHDHHPILGIEEFFEYDVIPVKKCFARRYTVDPAGLAWPDLIQNKVLKHFLEGRDCTIIAPKGSRIKTAFVSTIVDRIEKSNNDPARQLQGLVLVSTDEEAIRVIDYFNVYDRSLFQYSKKHFYAINGNSAPLPSTPIDVLVGTPSSIYQWIMNNSDEKELLFSNLKIFVMRDIDIDTDVHQEENQEKPNQFHQLSTIFNLLPETAQQLLIFKKIPRIQDEKGFISLLSRFSNKQSRAFYYYDWREMLQLEQFRQKYLETSRPDHLHPVQWLLENSFSLNLKKGFHVIIYCQSSESVNYVKNHLIFNQMNPKNDNKMIENVSLFCIDEHTNHEDKLNQLKQFHQDHRSILVSSISFEHEEINRYKLPLIIHYELPKDRNEYVLRSGGYPSYNGDQEYQKEYDTLVISFIKPSELNQLKEYEKILTEMYEIHRRLTARINHSAFSIDEVWDNDIRYEFE